MTLTPEGGAAIPVSVTTTRKVQGGAAIPVYGYMTAPTDGRPAMGGSAIPVRVLTAADLKQNGGQWTLEGRPHAMPVYTAPATTTVMGGPALAVYPVNAWPTVPVVPPVWVPTDIASLALWLKADAGTFQDAAKTTPAVADTDPIGAWADQSGNGKDVVQATAGKRPLLKLNIKNSNPVIRIDATDDFLRTAAGTVLAQPNTIFVVSFVPTNATNRTLIDDRAGATRNALWYGTDGRPVMHAGSLVTDTVDRSNVWCLFSAVFNGASSSLRFNGAPEMTGNAGANALSLVTVGSNYLGGANLNGDVGEILVYNALLTAPQIAQVETYLNDRWAVY